VTAVSNVEEITAVEGLDTIFLGLSDLSVDLGVPGQWHHPRVTEHIDRVMEACAASGVAFGLPTDSPELAKEFVGRGARFIATGDVGIFSRAMQNFVREVKPSSD
jgi:4-hydroxy-2-oxoheptanedioate aldolase